MATTGYLYQVQTGQPCGCIYQVLANIDEHLDLDITLVTRALNVGWARVQCAASVVREVFLSLTFSDIFVTE